MFLTELKTFFFLLFHLDKDFFQSASVGVLVGLFYFIFFEYEAEQTPFSIILIPLNAPPPRNSQILRYLDCPNHPSRTQHVYNV